MNILYLCDEYPPGRNGGIGSAVQLLGREMVKQGHNIIVAGFYDWGYGGEDYFDDEGVKVYRFRRRLSSKIFYRQDALYVRAIYRLFKNLGILQYDIAKSIVKYGIFLEELIGKYKIDLIEMPEFCDYMRFCKSYVPFPKLSVPVIVKLHGGITFFLKEANKEVPPIIWEMEHDVLMQATCLISVSKDTANKYTEYFQLNKKIAILYNGIDTKIYINDVEKIPGRVIFTGTLIEKKGIFQLMKAWNLVVKKNSGAELFIYGKGPIKKITELLTPEARRKVYFKGHVERDVLLNVLGTAEVAVFPSLAETFGLAPIEAMMCGTATIFTKTTSGPEIISDGEDGILINPENEEEIADKIILLLNHPEIAKNLAKNGRNKIIRCFSIDIIAIQHIKFYLAVKKANKK